MRIKTGGIFIVLTVILIGIMLVSLSLGKYPVDISDLVKVFLGKLNADWGPAEDKLETLNNLVFEIRLPRILTAVLIGSALSISGAVYQAMFVNPLVSPSLLGVLAGSSFGAAFGMIFTKSWIAVQVMSFSFGLAAVGIAIGLAKLNRGNTMLLLILGGVISGAFFSSLLSILKYIADPYEQLPALTQWLMGSLSFADKSTLLTASVPTAAGMFVIMLLSGYINALSMGDDEAKALGVPVEKIRFILILFATIISALTVVMAGIIGWVGLVIPHITRMITGPDNKKLLPACALIGAAYLTAVDDVSRLMFNVEIPIGITTSLIGIPFFAIMLKQTNKAWN